MPCWSGEGPNGCAAHQLQRGPWWRQGMPLFQNGRPATEVTGRPESRAEILQNLPSRRSHASLDWRLLGSSQLAFGLFEAAFGQGDIARLQARSAVAPATVRRAFLTVGASTATEGVFLHREESPAVLAPPSLGGDRVHAAPSVLKSSSCRSSLHFESSRSSFAVKHELQTRIVRHVPALLLSRTLTPTRG